MDLNIAICEDEWTEYQALRHLLDECGQKAEPDYFGEGSALLNSFYPGKYDLVLLDIYMEGMGGVDTVANIRRMDMDVPVAFITTSLEHALEGYQFHVIRYLVKPLKKADVQELLDTADKLKKNLPALTVRLEGQEHVLPFRQIRYVEQNNHTLFYHLTGGRQINVRGRLDELERSVPCPPFFRCHKSFLVNLSHVHSFNKDLNVFDMSEGGVVYVRRQSSREAAEAFRSFIFAQMREEQP